MAKHLQLSIAEPCHEDWDKMTQSEKGRFCGSCQKQVIDFTGMTDTQLATFFKKKSTASTCGMFYEDQLNRNIPVPRKRIPWVKYFFQFTLPLFLTTLKVKAQKGEVKVETVQTETCWKDNIFGNVSRLENPDDLMDLVVEQGTHLKGNVVDEEGKPVPFASIEKGLVGTAADSTGAFSLVLAPNPKGIKLKISSVGFKPAEVTLSAKQISGKEPIVIRLTPNTLMEEVIVLGYGTGRRMGLMGATAVVTHICVTPEMKALEEPSFKMYANPARANADIFINPLKTEVGSYAIQLLNISGQLIKQQESRIEKGTGSISFGVPSIPSGTYLITLLNKKTGKKFSEKLIVQ
jgi:hypothetical protein